MLSLTSSVDSSAGGSVSSSVGCSVGSSHSEVPSAGISVIGFVSVGSAEVINMLSLVVISLSFSADSVISVTSVVMVVTAVSVISVTFGSSVTDSVGYSVSYAYSAYSVSSGGISYSVVISASAFMPVGSYRNSVSSA